ncbi:anthranilate synthase component I [Staphylococcus schleiferi subsp. coagulans]|uniref:anthranilate synthase component I n=1 Tax=Staphylococcus coagulans TaxID=74706 RepID=UPI0015FE4C32|nr:anthranilate synthase component I [Staphylococcus coagulans]MBA8760137.1 anthranilate synthase component I [Staphylococcus coagulans]MBA8768868.1 anthranilate synthase component I [Staphylococcus coagulans]
MNIRYRILDAPINPETLARHKQHKIVLESATTSQTKGRYSVVAFDTYGEVTLTEAGLNISTPQYSKYETDAPFEKSKAFIGEHQSDIKYEALQQLPFISGFMGYCSFDLVRHAFPILQQYPVQGETEDVHFYMIESVYVFDHYKEQIYVIVTNLFSGASEQEMAQRLDAMIDVFSHIQLFEEEIEYNLPQRKIETNIDEATFINQITQFKKLIQEGDMFQVVPSRVYKYAHGFGHHLHQLTYRLYQKLKRKNPSPYLFYLNMGGPILIGSSPESFVKVKDGKVMTNPIAGTIKRGATEEEDFKLAQILLEDEKELSEHRMLVDLGRNDILRIAKPNSLEIPKLMTIERYEHVMHIVTEVVGEIDAKRSPLDMIASLLPTGTVSGAPKLRAIQRIYENHPYKRGVYSGGVGYINCDHTLDLALAIRTMVIDDNDVHVEAGCGVVYDSVPEKELEETKLKAKSLLEITL